MFQILHLRAIAKAMAFEEELINMLLAFLTLPNMSIKEWDLMYSSVPEIDTDSVLCYLLAASLLTSGRVNRTLY